MLRFKPEVRIGVWTPAIAAMLAVASDWSLEHRADVVVTSIADDAPGRLPNSLHRFGLAMDCDPSSNAPADRESLANYFRVMLPAGFDVVFESSHVHAEFDPHRAPLTQIPG